MSDSKDVCCYCGKLSNFPADPKSELRPYGPGGALVCFGCAMKPEHEKQTHDNFMSQFDAADKAGGGVVVIGENTGPRPLDKKGTS